MFSFQTCVYEIQILKILICLDHFGRQVFRGESNFTAYVVINQLKYWLFVY